MGQSILIRGMHGLGDNIHQRAVVRQFLASGYEIWLQTPWPNVFHDFSGPQFHLIAAESRLRTQAKNEGRHRAKFIAAAPRGIGEMRVWYTHDGVRQYGFLGAMLANCQLNLQGMDYRLPVPQDWYSAVPESIERGRAGRPLLLLRPLVDRNEWAGCTARNPDAAVYAELFAVVRKSFFVVSVADFEPNREWPVGPPLDADIVFHKGELSFEALAALTASAALVFCSPGFAIALGQAVEVRTIAIFGGHESSRLYASAACWAPFLGIDPIKPCECFRKDHGCDKRIDLVQAQKRLGEFVDAALADHRQIENRDDYSDRLERVAG
jgi:hypothetical protein